MFVVNGERLGSILRDQFVEEEPAQPKPKFIHKRKPGRPKKVEPAKTDLPVKEPDQKKEADDG